MKSCLFFLPYITAIMATDGRAGGIHHLNGVLTSYPKAFALPGISEYGAFHQPAGIQVAGFFRYFSYKLWV
ncbi:hypothetical protein [Erwinia piriflorinigrans]|uniref:hypothetical protein n=1 Tax=Erwinia piriflorinigrans TaxID=665097 RepID=UPI0009080B4D|nr:hypothetical protein [Erwinia piriflorinigrans]